MKTLIGKYCVDVSELHPDKIAAGAGHLADVEPRGSELRYGRTRTCTACRRPCLRSSNVTDSSSDAATVVVCSSLVVSFGDANLRPCLVQSENQKLFKIPRHIKS